LYTRSWEGSVCVFISGLLFPLCQPGVRMSSVRFTWYRVCVVKCTCVGVHTWVMEKGVNDFMHPPPSDSESRVLCLSVRQLPVLSSNQARMAFEQ
jgi:hypothetical protein